MAQLKGTPLLLDVMLRPIGRGIQVVFASVFTAAFFMLEWWSVLPLPAAFAVLAYELFFWVRGDRACKIRLDDSIRFIDPIRDQALVIEPAEIRSVRLHYRRSSIEGHAVSVVIADSHRVCFAVQLDEVKGFVPRDHDVDSDTMDAVLGATGNTIRALAPHEVVCRQVVVDTKGTLIEWLRRAAPPDAWRTISLRGWLGEEPELDLFGYHVGTPDVWCHLYGPEIEAVEAGERSLHSTTPMTCGTSLRQAVLFRPHERGELDPQGIPLLILGFGELRFAIPAPIAAAGDTHESLNPRLLHLHVPDGAALIWHLCLQMDGADWPDRVRESMLDSRIATGALPSVMTSRLAGYLELS